MKSEHARKSLRISNFAIAKLIYNSSYIFCSRREKFCVLSFIWLLKKPQMGNLINRAIFNVKLLTSNNWLCMIAFCGRATWQDVAKSVARVLFTKRSDNFILELTIYARGENNFPENRFEFEPCATKKLDLRARSFNLPLTVAGRMRI